MSERDDDRFRPKLGKPKAKDDIATQRFISRVAKAANQAGTARRGGPVGRQQRRLSQLHRGGAVARTLNSTVNPRDRRVLTKSRLVNLRRAGPQSTQTHLKYLGREGVTQDGARAMAYGPHEDQMDVTAFESRSREDRHQFRFIVSPEDASELQDLRAFIRELMTQVQKDLGTRLDWVAVDHWNTDNPHTHIVLRGKDDRGRDLIIARDYIAQGMRTRAAALATEWLGPRTEREIQQALQREVVQERWTSLDAAIQRRLIDGQIDLRVNAEGMSRDAQRPLMVGRLQTLQQMGLATQVRPGIWAVHDNAQEVLRVAGERGDIIRTMQRAMGGRWRPMEIFDASNVGRSIVGRVLDTGLIDELSERRYVVIEGLDGPARYVPLGRSADAPSFPAGAILEVQGARVRAADREIVAHTREGIYDSQKHLTAAKLAGRRPQDAEEYVTTHVRRLEALRRGGIVERLNHGRWQVPQDLVQQGRGFDLRRSDGAEVRVLSTLSVTQQVRAIGATWLDRQLLADPAALPREGFGAEVRSALQGRLNFLVSEGFADRREGRVVLRPNLLAALRDRELAQVANSLTNESGSVYMPAVDGQRVTGIYRRSLSLISGRFALLDTDGGIALVPWRAVLEKRRDQLVSGVLRGEAVSWEFGPHRTLGR